MKRALKRLVAAPTLLVLLVAGWIVAYFVIGILGWIATGRDPMEGLDAWGRSLDRLVDWTKR